ncbi:hypothetical protein BN874_1100008 [Candidatus Contendobacter odensis Run_B_J11]|uniref:Uncharacterized protein n=1 Tax=Candidatus Contendobacter odensis Run_B_J11 TaxID=1400861 RepID=A0A7U7G7I2_9GAMM|nr:hypothetical protein BN874_1100008 [Candidatus Contendobacter odensis Run_B_J11]
MYYLILYATKLEAQAPATRCLPWCQEILQCLGADGATMRYFWMDAIAKNLTFYIFFIYALKYGKNPLQPVLYPWIACQEILQC